ncbi:uncharacterized protein LOC111044840 isoform X3 [Nilaparvata lugens]|uniref:uncharacterized protein LOC111044840 isoform X3 n=1 Tax=Nilaparvata lugens TaxID=108931 RepID=UPI00193DADD2|nr:uncharacterized protein LOC111044840 isoform X3 [Nilaparvata lugens]
MMQRARHQHLPPTPHTLEDVREVLRADPRLQRTRDGAHQFYVDEVAEGSIAFVSRRTAEFLSQHPAQAQDMFIDGTFKIVPRNPRGLRQLLSVHIIFMSVMYPVAFFLLTNATAETYRAILNFLKLNVVTWAVAHVTTDYERALIQGVRNAFPQTEAHGCWFHYCQAIWRRVVAIGLRAACLADQANMSVVRMIMSIPHLPPQRGAPNSNDTPPFSMADGVEAVRTFINEGGVDDRLHMVLEYITQFWMRRIPAGQLTTFARPRRTNNSLEGFHSKLLSFFGPHPNMWQFIRHLQEVEAEYYGNLRRSAEGIAVRRMRIGRANNNTTAIRTALRLLINRELSVIDFLRRVSHRADALMQVLAHPLQRRPDEQMADEEEELAAPQEQFNFELGAEVVVEMGPPIQHEPQPAEPLLNDHALYVAQPQPAQNLPEPQQAQIQPQPQPAPNPPAQAPGRGRGQGQGRGIRTCSICLVRRPSHAAIPCGHKCLCPQCAADERLRIEPMRCPLCRALMTNIVRIF